MTPWLAWALLACSSSETDSELLVPDTDIVLLALKAGTFEMGSPDDEVGRGTDEDRHSVTLSRDFWLGRTEITQAQFESIMGYSSATTADCPECPAETLSWSEAAGLANALSDAEGFDTCYRCEGDGVDRVCEARAEVYDCAGYRLPTEAEWEYAARAGSGAAFSNGGSIPEGSETLCEESLPLSGGGSLESFAWTCGTSPEGTQPVAALEPNAWGLYDMHGNVWELTQDWYEAYAGDVLDPDGASTGSGKVVRGGSWADAPRFARSATRSGASAERRTSWLGFRLARSR
jgi:formylglycine-generating enzyme required for sulfatase activity